MIAFTFLLLIFLLIIGVPIAFSLALPSAFFWIFVADISLDSLIQRMVGGINSFPLLAIPFFILAGEVMNLGGITQRVFRLANSLVGHITGGLGHVMVVASMIFAGMCGSSMAEAAGLCKVGLDGMKRGGYSPGFIAGLTSCAACIGPIIPPSIPFVIYGGITGVSVGRLFLGGVVPGLVMGLMLMFFVYILAKKGNYPKQPRASLREVGASVKYSFLALLFPLIIVGGIMTGIVTPTEAAVVAVAYAAAIAGFVYRQLKFSQIPAILVEIGWKTAAILFIIAAATPFGYMIAWTQMPHKLALFFTSVSDQPWIFLTILNIFIIILGCFMEGLTIMIILIPILQPVVMAYHIDPVQFGVILCLGVTVGLVTPPFGMNMFITTALAGIDVKQYIKDGWLFVVSVIASLFLISYFPQISVVLPNLLMGVAK